MEKENIINNWLNFVVVTVLVAIMLCIYNGSGSRIFNNGAGADETRKHIDEAREQQQSAIDRLGNVEAGLDDSIQSARAVSDGLADTAKTVDNTKDRIESSEGRLAESTRLIDEGKSILAGIRKRHEKED